MKSIFIREGRAVNPLFSNKEKSRAKREGKPYDVDPYITIPVGYEQEGPHCWTHCCPGYKGEPPLCKPADDECRERVKNWMEVERPKRLEQIRQMLRPSNLQKLKPKERKQVEELAEAYGLEAPEDTPQKPVSTGGNAKGKTPEN